MCSKFKNLYKIHKNKYKLLNKIINLKPKSKIRIFCELFIIIFVFNISTFLKLLECLIQIKQKIIKQI